MSNWLTTQANALLAIDQAQQETVDLLDLAQALQEEHPLDFLERLSQGVAAQPAGLRQEQLDRLRQWYEKKLAENEDIAKLRALFAKVGAICEKQGVQHTKTLAWPLEAKSAGGVDEIRLHLDLAFSSQASLSLVACAELPERAGKIPAHQAALLISAAGQVAVSAGASLPVGRLAVSLNASAKGALHFDYYSLHDRDSPPLAAVVAGFRQLGASPFDLAALSLQLQNGLKCVTLSGEGEISLGGRVALASPFSLAANQLTLVEMAYGYSASLSGAFNYHIQADTAAPGKVALFLKSARGTGQTRDAGIKVGLDLESALARIRQETLPFLGKAEALLAKADDLLQPGKRLRAELQEALAGLDTESGRQLAPLLESLLGFEPGRAPVEALSEALSERIQALGLDLSERTAGQAGPLLDDFLARLGVSADKRASLRDKLETRLDRALEKIRSSSEEKLKKLASGTKAHDLAEALRQAGLNAQADLDQPLAGMRLLLQRYRQVANAIIGKLGDATAAKLTASLGLVDKKQQGASVDLVLRFDPLDAPARQAFREVLLGSFEHALDLARNGRSGVEVLDCRLGRMVSHKQGADLEVAVLGFVLTSGSVLEASTEVELDASGNLTLISHAVAEKRRSLLGEKRSLRIADVFEVMAAGKTRSLKLDVTLSHEDDKLKPGELENFLGSLAAAKLLTPERVQEAGATLQLIRSTTPNCLHSGRVDVRLVLADASLETLMGVGMEAGVFENHVRNTAAQEMADAYLKKSRQKPEYLLADIQQYYGLSGALPEVILHFDNQAFMDGKPGEGFPIGSPIWNHARDLNRLNQLCEELHSALLALRDLYQIDAGEMEKMKDPDYCQQKQEAIMLYAKKGAPGDFPSLFGKESINPATLALFRILARLSGRKLDGSDSVEVTLTLCGGNEKQVRRIA